MGGDTQTNVDSSPIIVEGNPQLDNEFPVEIPESPSEKRPKRCKDLYSPSKNICYYNAMNSSFHSKASKRGIIISRFEEYD